MNKLAKLLRKILKPPFLWWVIGGLVLIVGIIFLLNIPDGNYVVTTEIKQAQELYSKGKIMEAKSKYETIIASDPKNVLAINSLGNIFRDLGQADKAEEAYLNVIDIDPRFDPVYRNLLTFYQMLEDEVIRDQKLELFASVIKKGVSLNKDSINVLDSAITFYRLIGDAEEAQRLQVIMDEIEL